MQIQMDADAAGAAGALARNTLRLQLEREEAVHLLHPRQLIVFQGPSSQREDQLLDLKGIWRKKKLLKAKLSGPAQALVALPGGYGIEPIAISGENELLFEFRHLLYYTDGVRMNSVVQSARHLVVTRDFVRMRFSGSGSIGILSRGPILTWELDPEQPVFVEARSLLAYPQQARLELCVYGNHLASQHMAYHWKVTGTGTLLLQGASADPSFEQELEGDGLFKRTLRELLPFGSIWIK